MSKYTQIKKADTFDSDGTPVSENVYDLYSDDKLIASDVPFEALAAAPEMLEMLKSMVAAFSHGDFRNGVEHQGIDQGDVYAGELYDAARALIAKATGGAE